jgi:hypothetical protein
MAVIVKLKEIIPPSDYIRGKYDRQRLDDFTRLVLGLTPSDKLPKIQGGKDSDYWPFPPITVIKTEVAAPAKKLKKGGKVKTKKDDKVKMLTRYEIIDGMHRYLTAKKVKRESIPVVIDMKVKTDSEKYLAQFLAANSGPLPLDPLQRAQCVWKMVHEYKIPQTKIVEMTGLHKSSVSRIASKKQGWEKAGRGSANYGKGDENGDKGEDQDGLTPPSVWSPDMWFDRIIVLFEEYQRQESSQAFQAYIAEKAKPAARNMIASVGKRLLDFISAIPD